MYYGCVYGTDTCHKYTHTYTHIVAWHGICTPRTYARDEPGDKAKKEKKTIKSAFLLSAAISPIIIVQSTMILQLLLLPLQYRRTVLVTLGWHNKHPLLPARHATANKRTLGPLFSFMFSFWKLSFPSPGYSQTFLPSGATSYVGGIADTPDKRPNEIDGHNRLDPAAPLLTQAHSQPSVYSLLGVLTAVY